MDCFRFDRHVFAWVGLGLVIGAVGCLGPSTNSVESPQDPGDIQEGQELVDRLDEVLNYTLHERRLSADEQAAWQILHGVLAYGQDFPVDTTTGTDSVVRYIQNGGAIRGFVIQPGRLLDESTGRRGLMAIMQPGTKAGQGHADQWLAILAQAELKLDDTIVYDGVTYTMADFVAQVKWDVPRNVDNEYSWTLIGLTNYYSTSDTWEAIDGEQWSVERLVELEAEYALGDGPCGGTHRLIGLAMALNKRRAEGLPISGVWSEAEAVVQMGIESSKRFQNADGSFSTNYVSRGGTSADLAQNLGTTGHLVEFLAIALPDEEIDEPWMRASVVSLCDIFDKTRDLPLECGALYHAAHGLLLYRNRLDSAAPYKPSEAPDPSVTGNNGGPS